MTYALTGMTYAVTRMLHRGVSFSDPVRSVESDALGDGCSVNPSVYAELAENVRHVHARGLLGHEQRLADLPVRQACRHQRENFRFARCQAELSDSTRVEL